MATLFIFAGFHKAGTTALQARLNSNSKALAAHGITYLSGESGDALHYFAKPTFFEKRKSLNARFAKTLKDSGTFAISSEFFSEWNQESLDDLKRVLVNHQVRVIFTARPLIKTVPSQYQQLVRIGLEQSFDNFVEELLENEAKSKSAKLFWQRHNQPQIIERWSNTFGTENVSVILVDENEPNFLFEQCAKFLDVPKELLKEQTTPALNRSLSAAELELIRLMIENRQFADSQNRWIKIYRNIFIKQLVSQPSKAKSSPIQLDTKLEKVFIQRSQSFEQQIRRSGVTVIGKWQITPAQIKRKMVPQELDLEALALAILALTPEKLIRQAPIGAIVAEVMRRAKYKSSRLIRLPKRNELE